MAAGTDNILEIIGEANFGPMTAATEQAAGVQTQATGIMQKAWLALREATASAAAGISTAVAKADAAVTEHSAHITERLTATAEGARVTSSATASAMGMLGAAFGAVLFFEFLNHLKESELELSHLADATGIPIVKLAELKFAMQAAGVSTERLPMQLTRLSRSMEEAANGGRKQIDAFNALGVSTKGWSEQLPDTMKVLEAMSTHLHASTENSKDLANMSAVLGRNVVGTTSFLKEGTEALRLHMEQGRKLAEAEAEAVESAKALQREEAQLTANLHSITLPVFSAIVTMLGLLQAGFIKWAAAFEIAGRVIMGSVFAIIDSYKTLFTVMTTAMTEGPKAALQAAKNGMEQIKADVQMTGDNIKTIWADANTAASKVFQNVAEVAEKSGDKVKDEAARTAKSIMGEWEHQLKAQADAANAMHTLTLEQEKEFWTKKLALAKQGSQLYKEVEEKLFELSKSIAERDLKQFIETERAKEEAFKRGSPERMKIEEGILAHLRALGMQKSELYTQTEARIIAIIREYGQQHDAENTKRLDNLFKMGEIEIEQTRRIEQDKIEAERERINASAAMGRINESQRTAALKALLQREYDTEKQAIQRKIELYKQTHVADPANPTYLTDLAKFNSQVELLHSKLLKDLNKLDTDFSKNDHKRWTDHFTFLKGAYAQFFNGIISGQMNLKQALGSIGQAILQEAVGYLAQQMTEWTAHLAAKLGFKKLFDSLTAKQAKVAAAEQHAQEKLAALAEIKKDAAVAFAGTYALMSALVPPPGPQIAAAAASAVVLAAAGPVAAFANGGIVPGSGGTDSQIVAATPGEGVFTPEQMAALGPGGGVTIIMPSIQAIDSTGVANVMDKYATLIDARVRRALRDNNNQ
jgi:hypothetical protein